MKTKKLSVLFIPNNGYIFLCLPLTEKHGTFVFVCAYLFLQRTYAFFDTMEQLFYTVAGHTFSVEIPRVLPVRHLMPAYQPFVEERLADPLFALHIELCNQLPLERAGSLLRRLDDDAAFIWVYRQEDAYAFGFSNHAEAPECLLFVDSSYRDGQLFVLENRCYSALIFDIDNSLMLLYALNTARRNTLLIHASVVRLGNKGFAFLGKSGTGKSTHSRLWLTHIEGAELVNDDNPVVRWEQGHVFVYGSPWSGKTPCYKNIRAELSAIVRLSQAPENRIERLTPLQAYGSLLSSSSCLRWERSMADGVHHTVEQVIRCCPNYHLACLPDKEAVQLVIDTCLSEKLC